MTIREAIERSISHDEIVSLQYAGDSGDAIVEIDQVWDGDTDYRMIDHEGVDHMDVWGWTDQTQPNEQDWRLDIYFVD